MRLVRSVLVICFCVSSLSYAMEEQKTVRPLPVSEQLKNKFVRLELVNEQDKPIYRMKIPYLLAQESSVINNILQFKEEEEGQEPLVPLLLSTISIAQFKVLGEFSKQYYIQKNIGKAVRALSYQWYSDQLNKYIDLIIISNYIGNERLLHSSIKELYKVLQKLAYETKWSEFFQLGILLEIPELQSLLGNKIKKNNDINILMNKLFKSTPFMSRIGFLDQADMVAGKQWLVAKVMHTKISRYLNVSRITIINMQTKKVVGAFNTRNRVYGHIKISPAGDIVIVQESHFAPACIYSIETGSFIDNLPIEGYDGSFCFSSDGKLIVASGYDHIYLIEVKGLKIKRKIPIGFPNLLGLAISPNNRFIAFLRPYDIGSPSWGWGVIEIWDIQNEKKYKEVTGIGNGMPLLFSPNNKYLAYGDLEYRSVDPGLRNNGRVKILNLENDVTIELPADGKKDSGFAHLAFSSDNRFLATGFNHLGEVDDREFKRALKILDFKKAKVVIASSVSNDSIKSLGFSPNGKKFAYIREAANRSSILSIIDLVHEKLENLSMQSLLLLRYFAIQEKNNQPVFIPKGYDEFFLELPKEVRQFFHDRNVELGQAPTSVPFIYPYFEPAEASPIRFLKEKRKEPEEKTKVPEEKAKKSKKQKRRILAKHQH